MEDVVAAGLEKVGCGGAGLVEEIVGGGCIAHGQHGCGDHDRGEAVLSGFEYGIVFLLPGSAVDVYKDD